MQKHLDIVCMGMALVDSIIKGFDPEPISASVYRARSGSLNVGGEAVNEAVAAARLSTGSAAGSTARKARAVRTWTPTGAKTWA